MTEDYIKSVSPSVLINMLANIMSDLALTEAKFGMVLNAVSDYSATMTEALNKNSTALVKKSNQFNTWMSTGSQIMLPIMIFSGVGQIAAVGLGAGSMTVESLIGYSKMLLPASSSFTGFVMSDMKYQLANAQFNVDCEKSITDMNSSSSEQVTTTISGAEDSNNNTAQAMSHYIRNLVPMSTIQAK